jgi:hypothetical protein
MTKAEARTRIRKATMDQCECESEDKADRARNSRVRVQKGMEMPKDYLGKLLGLRSLFLFPGSLFGLETETLKRKSPTNA